MMRYRIHTLLLALAVTPPVLAGVLAWNRLNMTNCGGNGAAVSRVREICLVALMIADTKGSREFSISLLSQQDRDRLSSLAEYGWTRDAKYFISAKSFAVGIANPKELVVFCNRPFTNVPRHIFGEAPPTYAVGFSDGSTSLITARQFATLDKSAFVCLSELAASNP